jgi:hypothetical protein
LDRIIGSYTTRHPAVGVLQVMDRGGDNGGMSLVGHDTPVFQDVGEYPVAAAVLVVENDDDVGAVVATNKQEMAQPLLSPSDKSN